MLLTLIISLVRIFSNSYLNIFQKLLTIRGEKSSVVNFYTYFGLLLIGLLFSFNNITFNIIALPHICIMGILGALGNYFIIKALSVGELSSLAPINSYKPLIALIFGIFILKEYPTCQELFGIFLIIFGTYVLSIKNNIVNKAFFFRFLALIFSGTEAILIKKVIILTDIPSTFLYWALSGFIFSFLFMNKDKLTISKHNFKYQILLIILVSIMQYSTNYVFSKLNTAHALAIFQLSTILSVFLGVNIFKEKGLLKKIIASFIMIFGATILILR